MEQQHSGIETLVINVTMKLRAARPQPPVLPAIVRRPVPWPLKKVALSNEGAYSKDSQLTGSCFVSRRSGRRSRIAGANADA